MSSRRKMSPGSRRIRYTGKRAASLLIFVLIAIGLICADRLGLISRKSEPDETKYNHKTFRVVKVIDGDTLDIDVADGKFSSTRIRLWGVDTPETVKPNSPVMHFGPQASEFTKQATMGKDVRIELEPTEQSRDKHGRLLAFVYLPDGKLLNLTLLEEGYAYADPRYKHFMSKEFADAQKQAMAQRKGLWQDVTDDQLPFYLQGKLKLPAANQPAKK